MSTIAESAAGMRGTPALMIRIPVEGAPTLWVDALHESEALRLDDWLQHGSEGIAELIAVALREAGYQT
jgi:hypothetical protein